MYFFKGLFIFLSFFQKALSEKIYRFDEEMKLAVFSQNKLFAIGNENTFYIIDTQVFCF